MTGFFKQSSLLIGLAVLCSIVSQGQGFSVGSKSPAPVNGTDSFVSTEGGFSISLPQDFHGFRPVSANSPTGRITGDSYDWTMKEGSFTAGYIDRPETLDEPATAKRVLGFMRNSLVEKAKAKGGTFVSERSLSGIGHPARELRIDFPDGLFIQRTYLVLKRMYLVSVILHTDQRSNESVVVPILDSFKILNDAEVDAALRQKIANATPSPLPQEPAAPRQGSDAQDYGLKGKVKTVFTESEDLSGTWAVGNRKPSSMSYYNQQGNLTKKELYDWKGNLFDITVYGYLDGSRVSHFKSIRYEYDPPPMMIAAPPGAEKPKYDLRYSHRLEYKYDDENRLTEEIMYGNSGKLWLRYVYKYPGNQKEEFVYSEEGKLIGTQKREKRGIRLRLAASLRDPLARRSVRDRETVPDIESS